MTVEEIVQRAKDAIVDLKARNEMLSQENARLREALLNEQDEHSDDKLYYQDQIAALRNRLADYVDQP